MIFPYNKERGVPRGQYYIEETKQFADFEISEIKEITFYSRNKEELIKMCLDKKWACPDARNATSWFTHHIKQRSWML